MSEIKPVYQAKICGDGNFSEITEAHYQEIADIKSIEKRILYPAAAYEAKCNEVDQLQKENADLQLRLDAKTLSHQLMLDRTLELQAENDEQKRKIISLENELVEWNEFKKIRDMQMQALRKQMS